MRIRIIQKPSVSSVEGLRLDVFEPGSEYDVGSTLGALFLAEGWAEPVVEEAPALLGPLSDTLVREVIPPYVDHLATASDRRTRGRLRR